MHDFNYYLITDPKYYTNNLKEFEEKLNSVLLSKKVDIACFRDKSSLNFHELANCFLRVCKKHNISNIFINQNIKLAKELGFDGIHLTSTQFDDIKEAREAKLKTIISCHNEEDIIKAVKLQANMVTYSPIFKTPNKGNPKGIQKLQEVVNKFDIDIIALGGIISKDQIEQIKTTNAKGFASIRYFI